MAFIGCLHLQLMKATVLAESSTYFIFSPGSLHSSNIYRCESGRWRILPFFLTSLYFRWTAWNIMLRSDTCIKWYWKTEFRSGTFSVTWLVLRFTISKSVLTITSTSSLHQTLHRWSVDSHTSGMAVLWKCKTCHCHVSIIAWQTRILQIIQVSQSSQKNSSTYHQISTLSQL